MLGPVGHAVYLNNDHLGDLAAWLDLPSTEQVMSTPAIALATAWLTTVLGSGPAGPPAAHLPDRADAVLPDGTSVRAALP